MNISAIPRMISDAFHEILEIIGELFPVGGSEAGEFGRGDDLTMATTGTAESTSFPKSIVSQPASVGGIPRIPQTGSKYAEIEKIGCFLCFPYHF